MNSLLRECLTRTLLLMRDELRPQMHDAQFLDALWSTEVVLIGDANNLTSHAAQCAFITTALLMARSGHHVYLLAPEQPILGHQPPLKEGTLISALHEAGRDLLPGIEFSVGLPAHSIDLCVTLGDSQPVAARRTIALNASAWSAWLGPPHRALRWRECDWPLGSLAAAVLAAGEAFKVSMRRLRRFAQASTHFDKQFAPTPEIRFELAPANTPMATELGAIDFVSGGAIIHAVLYSLLRIPALSGAGRIIENTRSDDSNLNRYVLLRRSDLLAPKAETLVSLQTGTFRVQAAPVRFDEASSATLAPLAPRIIVGVDHIPTRWLVQHLQPAWLGIGATTHWSAMASFHEPGVACARCLHPVDDDNDAPIPTVAFVSFWAGLLLSTYVLRSAAGVEPNASEQHVFLTPLRPETAWWGPVASRPSCPTCGRLEAA